MGGVHTAWAWPASTGRTPSWCCDLGQDPSLPSPQSPLCNASVPGPVVWKTGGRVFAKESVSLGAHEMDGVPGPRVAAAHALERSWVSVFALCGPDPRQPQTGCSQGQRDCVGVHTL